MIIKRAEKCFIYKETTLNIDEEYLYKFNKDLTEYNNAGTEVEVTAEDIANVMSGVDSEKLEIEIIHNFNIFDEVRSYVKSLGDLIEEWVSQDFYEIGDEEVIDGEYDIIKTEVIES